MSLRDDEDDTSPGAITQGGSAPRKGNSIFWAVGLLVIILAVLIAVLTLPKKHSSAEEGTAPVSSGLSAPGPAGAVAAPTTPAPRPSPSPPAAPR